jgi:GT2 family glycosyltransferase
MKIAIAIATAGRKDVLSETISFLSNQEVAPDCLLICPAAEGDYDSDVTSQIKIPVEIIGSPRGLTSQRNALIKASDADVMIFLDDDFLPASDFVSVVKRLFEENPDIVIATGCVLADGILTRGLEFAEGVRILQNSSAASFGSPVNVLNAYGCNMIVRLAPVRANRVYFDEKLPLYGWLEDVDFSTRLASFGRVVRHDALRGVHLGTKRSGRSPGRRLGYSQIANPVYMAQKGSITWRHAVAQMTRNILANAIHSFRPEPWVDRKGRLRGNFNAIGDYFVGRLNPGKVIDL